MGVMDGVAPVMPPVTGADFFARARARLSLRVPRGLNDPEVRPQHGDHELDPQIRAIAEVRPIRPAAVLIPVIDHGEATILLTQRTATLSSHAGQVAFPGGRIDSGDASPLAAALREAEEEIGLDRSFVEPIGYLDVYMTRLGYRIAPLVACVVPGFTLKLNAAEVEAAFEVPLSFVMQPENHRRHSREWQGVTRSYYAMSFGERYIWGVTAGIVRNLYERIYG
jgi:8-oxo-dGTP pyrophosphatase MutT (NUDIX family)